MDQKREYWEQWWQGRLKIVGRGLEVYRTRTAGNRLLKVWKGRAGHVGGGRDIERKAHGGHDRAGFTRK